MVFGDVGVAIVPRIAVLHELRERRLVQISMPQLKLPLRSMMVFRRDSVSEIAGQLIEIMRNKLFVPRLHPDQIEAAN